MKYFINVLLQCCLIKLSYHCLPQKVWNDRVCNFSKVGVAWVYMYYMHFSPLKSSLVFFYFPCQKYSTMTIGLKVTAHKNILSLDYVSEKSSILINNLMKQIFAIQICFKWLDNTIHMFNYFVWNSNIVV